MRVLQNDLGQVLDIGTLIVYPKFNGTLSFRFVPGVITNILDKNVDRSILIVATPNGTIRLSNYSRVTVVELSSLNLPTDDDRLIREALKPFTAQTIDYFAGRDK